MYLCIYICAYVYIYVCVFVYVRIYIYTYDVDVDSIYLSCMQLYAYMHTCPYHTRRGCITLKLSSLISTRVPSSQCAIGDSEIDWNLTGSIRAITAQDCTSRKGERFQVQKGGMTWPN